MPRSRPRGGRLSHSTASRAPSPPDPNAELGIELLTRVSALFRIGRSYSVGNRLFVQQIESLIETAELLLKERGEFQFVSFGGEVFLDGHRIANTSHGFRMAKSLIAALEERGIAGFEVRGEPRPEEWQGFFTLLMDHTLTTGTAWIDAAAARGLERIVPVIRVLEEPASDSADPDGPGMVGSGESDPAAAKTDPSADPQGLVGAIGGRISPRALAALGSAPKLYAAAMAGLTSLVTSTTAQRGLEFRHARRVVQPIVDAAGSRDPVILGLAGMVRRDEYSYARNVNACMIATSIGQRLGLDRTDLATLAVAALLHGIGRAETTDPEKIGPAGAVLLARRTPLQELTTRVMRVALEAGGGPAPPGQSSVLSQIVSISAAYSRIVSSRGGVGKGTTPAQALGMIVGPLTGGFDPALKAALVETLGFHPPGQFVELDDGMIAMVIAPNRGDLDRPILQPCWGPGERALEPGLDWEGGELPPERSIIRDLTSADTHESERPAAA